MPKKSKRVAVRQAQLSQRKHRGRGPTAPEQMQRRGTLVGQVATAPATAASTELTAGAPNTAAAAALTPSATPRVASRRRESSFEPVWQSSSYLRREMIQIGAMSSLIFAILIALAFVLR